MSNLFFKKVNLAIMKNFNQSSLARFFTRFPKLLFAGLMYSIPFAVFSGIFILISFLSGFNNVILWSLGIIPAMPFYSGLVMVIRKISVEKEDVNVFKTFVQAFRENLKKSIFNGFVAYLIVACSFFAILYYGTLAQTYIVYGSVFTIYIVFSIAMLIMLFYVPLLTITYDLRLRDIYKNSLLLIFGKILRNIVALVLVVIVSFAVFLAVIYAKGAMLVVAVTLSVIFYPMIATYIIVSVIAKGVQESVGYFTGDNVQYVLTEEEVQRETEAVENANSDDDYIFVNGRMIKNPAKTNTKE